MASGPLSEVLSCLRAAGGQGEGGPRSDADLLARFATSRDEGAFTELVRRHGPLVLGVCRRVLRRCHDVEDCFQATFLVLAKKVGAIARPELLGSWLYGVALRTARKARARAAGAPRTGVSLEGLPARAQAPDETGRVLDEELARLPEKYRAPIILCCLEGLSRPDAARRLGLAEGALKGLLERARQRLRDRLRRRGALAALPAVWPREAVPDGLAGAAARAGPEFVCSRLPLGLAVTLAEEALKELTVRKTTLVSLFALLALAGAGAGLLARPSPAPPGAPAPARRALTRLPAAPAPKEAPPVVMKVPGTTALAFSPDGRMLVVAGKDGSLRLFDGQGAPTGQLKGHDKLVRVVAFSKDGKWLASGDEDGNVRVWDWPARKQARLFKGPAGGVRSLAFSPDGRTLIAGGFTNEAHGWDVQTGAAREVFRANNVKESLLSAVFSPDGRRVLLGGLVALNEGSHWTTFSVRSLGGKETTHIKGARRAPARLPESSAYPPAVAFAPDGKAWAGAFCDHTILLHGPGVTIETHRGPVTGLAFTPDGKWLLSAGMDGRVSFANAASGREVARAERDGPVVALALARDGLTLATAHTDGHVRLRSVGRLLAEHRLDKKRRGPPPGPREVKP
jgi:RNA polymerase sigma factor (sigma-70 family)